MPESRDTPRDLRVILEEIVRCECRFSQDPLEHARNAVEYCQVKAREALAALAPAPALVEVEALVAELELEQQYVDEALPGRSGWDLLEAFAGGDGYRRGWRKGFMYAMRRAIAIARSRLRAPAREGG